MCEFQAPYLLFYAYLPALFLSFVFAFFILFADRKSQINRNLFVFIILFSFWILNDLFAWLVHDQSMNLTIERLSLLEVFSVLFFLYFAHAFSGKNLSIVKKVILAVPFLPILGLLFTNYNVYVVDYDTCQNQNGLLYPYLYLIVIIYITWSVKKLLSSYKENKNEQKRKQVKIIVWAIIFFATWFLALVSGWYLLTTNKIEGGDMIYLFLPLGMVIFIGMLSTAIVRYSLFNIKLIASQVLTYAIWILIGSQFFFVKDNPTSIVLAAVTLLLSIIFGIVLIRSVKLESQRKEELQLMADALAVSNDKLRKLDNAKTEFISIASHQLRTPLTAIKGFVALLLEGSYGDINNEMKSALTNVHVAAERLINLVEDLLNVSRIESGRMEYKKEEQSISKLLKELESIFEIVAKNKGLSFEVKKTEASLPNVLIDDSKMREVLSNLIDNALKYTERGGVAVRAEYGPTSNYKPQESAEPAKLGQRVEHENTGANGFVRVIVSDTGIGIPATELPYLFSKFSRGKDTSRLHVGGTGLGLFVGKNIVEAHGGHIWAESDGDGLGSRFIVELLAV